MSFGGRFASLRLRLALLSGSLTAVFVIVACLVLWDLTYRFNLDTLDATIERIGRSNLERVSGQAYWRRLDESLSVLGGESDTHAYVIFVTNDGRLVYRSERWPEGIDAQWKAAVGRIAKGGADAPEEPRRGEPVSATNPALPVLGVAFDTVVDGVGGRWRLGVLKNHYQSLAIALDMGAFEAGMGTLRNRFLWVSPFALLGAAGMAWWFAQRSLKPVSGLTAAVENVNASGLDYRVDVERYDPEYRRLALMFNEMLERLEKAFCQASRFSSDASHELKTPLARLQMELEAALEEAEAESKEQVTYSNLLDEIGRLGAIVRKLMLLSASDSGKLELSWEEVDLTELLGSVVEDCDAMAVGPRFELSIPAGVTARADRVLLEQALMNLCSNALKYGAAEGVIRIELRPAEAQGRTCVVVANQGEAIPVEDWERIFDRFYRRDGARSGLNEGVGLGLSLTREILRAHGGEVRLARSDAQWTEFEVLV